MLKKTGEHGIKLLLILYLQKDTNKMCHVNIRGLSKEPLQLLQPYFKSLCYAKLSVSRLWFNATADIEVFT